MGVWVACGGACYRGRAGRWGHVGHMGYAGRPQASGACQHTSRCHGCHSFTPLLPSPRHRPRQRRLVPHLPFHPPSLSGPPPCPSCACPSAPCPCASAGGPALRRHFPCRPHAQPHHPPAPQRAAHGPAPHQPGLQPHLAQGGVRARRDKRVGRARAQTRRRCAFGDLLWPPAQVYCSPRFGLRCRTPSQLQCRSTSPTLFARGGMRA